MIAGAARRVLLVGDFSRSSFGAQFYNTNFVLQAGFIRAGWHVVAFSDRDTAREVSILGHKAWGRAAMNRSLIQTARTYQPQLVLFGHADMCGEDTFAAIRRAVPGVRLAQFNVDPLFRRRTMERFAERARQMDLSFITTADQPRIKALGAPPGTIAFFPNPVDASLSVADVSCIDSHVLKFDGIFLGSDEKRRGDQVTALMAALPGSFRFLADGGIFGTKRLSGHQFLEALTGAAMSPNLPLDDTVEVNTLYSSDRIAQLLGNGLVAFCRVEAGLQSIYEDGIVTYSTIADLAEKMSGLHEDDARRREIGATGRRIACDRTSAERVANYMCDLIFGDGPSVAYGWPCELM